VPIDSFTDVPADLFDRLLKDGMRAKARGQHRLCRSSGTKRQHLVRDTSPRPVRRETTSHVGTVHMRDTVQTASSFTVACNISSKRESIVPKTYTNARRATCSRDQMPGSAKVVPQRCRSLANDTSQAQGTKYSAPQRVKPAVGDERESRSIPISWWADSACGPVAPPAPWFSETVEGLLHQAERSLGRQRSPLTEMRPIVVQRDQSFKVGCNQYAPCWSSGAPGVTTLTATQLLLV